jgi:hypothetical protein
MDRWQRFVRGWHALAFVLVFCGFTMQPAYADGSVSSLRMGYGAPDATSFAHFQSVVAQYNASGERFRIDGHCQSACTMFLSIRNVCVSPDATLLFHAGGTQRYGVDPRYTQMMLSTYNSALQQYLTAGHYMDTLAFHPISGSEIIKRFGYPACR